jgi:hypothetical protein
MVVLYFFVLVRGCPTTNFLAVLIHDSHGLREYLPGRALDRYLLRMVMVRAIKAAETSVGQAAEVMNIWLGTPEGKSIQNFRITGSARWPNVFDEAISNLRLHCFPPEHWVI